MIKKFKFADFFAGIGGFHQIMSSLGGECVFACEIDKEAASVYETNYFINPLCDIKDVKGKDIENFDVMCGGFPCQGFSIGCKKLGFEDERGTLFFQLVRILRENYESNIKGVYPIGEGAGYAGGITSSALDGIKCALKIISDISGGVIC